MEMIYVPARVQVTKGPHEGRVGTVQGVYAMNADVVFHDDETPARAGVHRDNLKVIEDRTQAEEDFAEFPESEKRKEACVNPACEREDVHPEHDTATEFPEAVEQMSDAEGYKELRAVPFSERHACPIKDCNLSAEEHHRLAYGMIAENRDMKRRLALLEGQA